MISSPKQLGCMALLAGLSAGGLAATSPAKAPPRAQSYIVQLKGAPVASYAGGLPGLPSTRAAEGQRLNSGNSAALAYRSHLLREQDKALAMLGTGFKPSHRYSVAFNGFAARLTAQQVRALRASGRVKLLLPDTLRTTSTVSTPTFLGLDGASGVWSRLRKGSPLQGEDVIIGTIDTGVQPENPAFYDQVDVSGAPVASGGTLAYGPAPAHWQGRCVIAPAFPAGSCNNKLIGAKFFSTGWLTSGAEPWFGTFSDSPRDEGGHGTHTLSTAGGNAMAPAFDGRGLYLGTTSGAAPRARLASYKALFTAVVSGSPRGVGATSDILSAIDAAVADGVDIINYSVTSDPTNLIDPVEMAFLEATAANIFVAAAAGNNGPYNDVQNPVPWVTTVGASTHDRNPHAQVSFGNGANYSGPSFNAMAVSTAPLALGQSLVAAGMSSELANWCAPKSLDPAKAAGRIVVCDRGGDIARLDKSAEVKRVGGLGMVLLNNGEPDLLADWHIVPTVHLDSSFRSMVRAYAATSGATASLGARYQLTGAVAPVMASFSSRGPNRADSRVLKPDLTAPGVGIVASFAYQQRSQAEHYAERAGTLVPPPQAAMLDGTSMATPHVAGIAALIRQNRPNWTPGMIQSALITTAGAVFLPDGSLDGDMNGSGAGHVQAALAVDPGLVYPAQRDDYLAFLCSAGWLDATAGDCIGTRISEQADLNQASIAATVAGSLTVDRKVRNVGATTATYTAQIAVDGFDAIVSPSILTVGKGETVKYSVKFVRTTAAFGSVSQGMLTWTDGTHQVRSPIQLRAAEFDGPRLVQSKLATDTANATLTFGFTGVANHRVSGFQAGTVVTGRVSEGTAGCQPVVIPEGTSFARAALLNTDFTAPGIDDVRLAYLDEAQSWNTGVEYTEGNQQVTEMHNPVAGNYSLCLFAFSTALGYTDYKATQWFLNANPQQGGLQARGWPVGMVKAGKRYPVTLDWAGLSTGIRYLGLVDLLRADGSLLNSTVVSVDPAGPTYQRSQSAYRLPPLTRDAKGRFVSPTKALGASAKPRQGAR